MSSDYSVIQPELDDFENAVYGEEVRDSMISAIKKIYDIASTGGGSAPTPVSRASDMTDTSKVYLYTGSESGYNQGHIYYYDGSAWVDGGEYGGGGSEELAYKVAFLGCPDAQTADSTRGFGNCTVIWSADKCVIVDLGNQTDASALIAFLGANSIRKIDAVIITHYHADHVRASGVQALINSNIDTSTCIWYLPHKNIDWSSFTGTTYESEESAVKALLSNPVYPITEGQTVNFEDFTVSFYNVNSSLYAGYYSYMYDDGMVVTDHTNYNNFSMVCLVKGCGKNIVLAADIERPAEHNMADVIAQADILQIPHHGLDTQPYDKAVSAVKAEYSILTSYGAQKERAFKTAVRPYVEKGMSAGTVLSTFNGNSVVFSVSVDDLTCTVGDSDISSGNAIGQMIVSGEDLDDYVTAGQYYIQNTSTASNVANIPMVNGSAIGGGTLTVKGGTNTANGITQIYIPAFTAKRYICVRTKTINGWGNWGILDFSAVESATDKALVTEFDSSSMTERDGYYLNAMCYAKSRGTFFLGFKASDDATYNGESFLCEVDTSFNVINSKFDVDYGRINDMCFANGKIYVAPGYSSYASYHYRVVEVDPDTLEVSTDTASHYPVTSGSPCSICYDEANEIFYLDIAPSGTSDHLIYKCDENFLNAERLADSFFLSKDDIVLQSMEFTGNRMIQISNSKNPLGVVYFRTYFNGLDYASAMALNDEEPEALVKKDNDLYLATIRNTTRCQIYKIKLSTEPNFVLNSSPSGGGVTSVNGQTGAVVIGNATASSAGLMSATDKANLDTLMSDYQSASTALG